MGIGIESHVRSSAYSMPASTSGRGGVSQNGEQAALFLGGQVEALALSVVGLHRAEQNL
jgi:hypothetical protein